MTNEDAVKLVERLPVELRIDDCGMYCAENRRQAADLIESLQAEALARGVAKLEDELRGQISVSDRIRITKLKATAKKLREALVQVRDYTDPMIHGWNSSTRVIQHVVTQALATQETCNHRGTSKYQIEQNECASCGKFLTQAEIDEALTTQEDK